MGLGGGTIKEWTDEIQHRTYCKTKVHRQWSQQPCSEPSVHKPELEQMSSEDCFYFFLLSMEDHSM